MAQIGLICRLARENPQCGYLRSRSRGAAPPAGHTISRRGVLGDIIHEYDIAA